MSGPASAAESSPTQLDQEVEFDALALKYMNATPEELAAAPAADIAGLNQYGQLADVQVTFSDVKFVKDGNISGPGTDSVSTLASTDGGTVQAATPIILCYSGKTTYTGRNGIGKNIFQSWVVGKWCTDGPRVVKSSFLEDGGQALFPGWQNQGRIASGSKVVSGQGRTWSQYRFRFQIGALPANFSEPCARVKGTGPRTYLSDKGCGAY